MKVICCNVNKDAESPCCNCVHATPHDAIIIVENNEMCDKIIKYCPEWKEKVKNICKCVEVK